MRSLSRAARETWCALAGSLALSVVVNWGAVRHPASTVVGDVADPLLQTWELAWGGHALLHHPFDLFHTNAFYPAKDSLAFSDSLLGYAPVGMIGSGPTAALVRYNLLFVVVTALAVWGPYLLARQLGARWPGAVVAGFVCGYAPWRLSQQGHLNILSTGGIALSLALLARGHGFPGGRPARPRLALAGWLVAAWQVTLGFGLGLAFVMLLGGISVGAVVAWLRRGRPGLDPWLVRLDLAGAAVLAVTVVALARVYEHAVSLHPEARRSVADVALYSPPVKGLFLAPQASWWWGGAQSGQRSGLGWPPEMCLLPGFVALALALTGLAVGRLALAARIALAVAVAVLAVFCLGTNGPDGGHLGFLLLHDHVPGWQGVRTPSRLVVLMLPAIAVLAAAGTDRLVELGRRAGANAGIGVGVVLAGLVLWEGMGTIDHPRVPQRPAGLDALGPGPAMVLPTDELFDEAVMWWTTKGFPTVVNGGSGFTPTLTGQVRDRVADFPDQTSLDTLRQIGVHTVAVVLDRLDQTSADALATEQLPEGVTRTPAEGVLLFRF